MFLWSLDSRSCAIVTYFWVDMCLE